MAWPFSKRNQLETKEHPSGAAFFVNQAVGWARWSKPRDYIREGYQMNVLVYRSIKEIVTAASSIKYELYNGETLVESHPVLDLLANPTPTLSYREWLVEMLVNRLLIGEQFCVASPETGRPVEMWPLNPVDMQVKPGRGGIAQAYIHKAGTSERTYPVDPMTGQGPCFYSKLYNPSDYWRGQSPLMAASLAADTHNAGGKWNFNLLRNSAKPSGLIRFKGAYPSGDMVQKMREYFKRQIQGSENAGEVPMLADDAEWVQLSQSARDMDFSNTMASMAKQIASAYGVPLPLIDNDASTFNNLEQAKERLYTDTVIPLMQDFFGALSRWLFPMFGIEGYELRLDMDSIPALEGLRQKMFERAERMYTAGILTLEESRVMIGYEEKPRGALKDVGAFDLPKSDLAAMAYGLEHKADSFSPTDAMRRNYRRGLDKHEEGLSGDGIEQGTIRMARKIADGGSVSAEWVRKANRWWARNERFLSEGESTPAYVSALLWGGAAGRDWYRARAKELDGE